VTVDQVIEAFALWWALLAAAAAAAAAAGLGVVYVSKVASVEWLMMLNVRFARLLRKVLIGAGGGSSSSCGGSQQHADAGDAAVGVVTWPSVGSSSSSNRQYRILRQ
jgi:hypothetical protein